MKILICAFEPIGDQPINASWEAITKLPPVINGVKISVVKIPLVYYKSVSNVMKLIENDDAITDVILVGESGGRSRIALEMIGVNFDDASRPDNTGVVRTGKKIDPDGPDAYFATLPVLELVQHLLNNVHIPIYLSWSAGQYLCNHVMYGVIHAIKEKNLNIRAGFVHIPYTNEQAAAAGTAGLPVDAMTYAIESIAMFLTNSK